MKMPVVDKIAIEHAIEHRRRGYRYVFVLHDVQGYEHEEVARSRLLGRHIEIALY